MATGTESKRSPAAPDVGGPTRNGGGLHLLDGANSALPEAIGTELRRTGRRLKGVDLAAHVVTWLVACLTFLLALAIVDHWLFDLGRLGRLAAFAVLMGGSLWYLLAQVGPLLLRRINPVYAARSIEEGAPELKNSLVNYLTTPNSAAIARPVREALEERAVADLERVDPEIAVDYSRLIRLGYVLAGVVGICCLYQALSPKNPLSTAGRVLAPWAGIKRPARIRIAEVTPGDAEILRGRRVTVTATLQGTLRASESARLLVSSADGQWVDEPLPMQTDEGRRVWNVDLPPGGDGLQQDLTYRVEAGDGVSSTFKLTLLPVPTIAVERVEYQPPAYTRLASRVALEGELSAVEGTRVVIIARASHPLKTAAIELDPRTGGRPAALLGMQVDGNTARGELVLRRREDGGPQYARYQLNCVTERGDSSEFPVVHEIEVLPDLAPVVEILNPEQRTIEVPENGRQRFEVRALDPDFGLAYVEFQASSGARPLASRREQQGERGQRTELFDISPEALGLHAGDVLICRAVAADNRQDADGRPAPNIARTEDYEVRVVAPVAKPQAGDETTPGATPPSADGGAGQERRPEQPMPGAEQPPQPGSEGARGDDEKQ